MYERNRSGCERIVGSGSVRGKERNWLREEPLIGGTFWCEWE